MGMSLEQAWSHVKALWPDATRLERHDGKLMACWKDSTIIVGSMFFCRIDPGIVHWPDGMTRYPLQGSDGVYNPATKDDYETMHDYMDK